MFTLHPLQRFPSSTMCLTKHTNFNNDANSYKPYKPTLTYCHFLQGQHPLMCH